MPPKPPGANHKLVAARRALGFHSQAGFADAFEAHALTMGMRLAVSIRQVVRWESARPPWPNPAYRRVLEDLLGKPMTALGFIDPDEVAPTTTDHGWRDLLDDVPERLHRLIKLENRSLSLRSFQTTFIPGQLQTDEYALSIILMHDPTLSLSAARERQRLRMDRVQRLMLAGHPAWFIVAEPALYQPIGSPTVLADQLGHLVDVVTDNPHIRLQILPTGAPFAVSAPCLILEPRRGRYVAWLEQITGSLLVDSADDVQAFMTTFDRLHSSALSPATSLVMIDKWRQELCKSIEFSANLVGSSPATPEMTIASRLRSSALPWASGTARFPDPQ